MSSNSVINSVPFLRTSRNFPQEAQPLAVEVNRSYIDIAEKVNDRVIGIFPTTKSAINGESWFVTQNRKQQAFRQIYPFTGTGNVAHGINWSSVSFISPNSYGTFTDGTNWYGAIYGSSTAIAAEVSFYVTSTNIVVLAGAAAPSITKGYINLEWVSQV